MRSGGTGLSTLRSSPRDPGFPQRDGNRKRSSHSDCKSRTLHRNKDRICWIHPSLAVRPSKVWPGLLDICLFMNRCHPGTTTSFWKNLFSRSCFFSSGSTSANLIGNSKRRRTEGGCSAPPLWASRAPLSLVYQQSLQMKHAIDSHDPHTPQICSLLLQFSTE